MNAQIATQTEKLHSITLLIIHFISKHTQNILLARRVLGEASVVSNDTPSLEVCLCRNRNLLGGDEPGYAFAAGRCGKRARVTKHQLSVLESEL